MVQILVCSCGIQLPDNVRFPLICNCGRYIENKEGLESTVCYKTICKDCKFFSCKGCSLYLRPCTVKQLWADQIDPPSQCPHKEKFLED